MGASNEIKTIKRVILTMSEGYKQFRNPKI